MSRTLGLGIGRSSLSASLSVLAAGAVLTGCMATTEYQLAQPGAAAIDLFAAPQQGLAKICVVRPQTKVLSYTAAVHDNGNLVGATAGDSYFCYMAQPGSHVIDTKVERSTAEALATVLPGKTYYLAQLIQTGFQSMNIKQQWLSRDEVEEQARSLHYMALVAAPHHEAPPQIGAVAPALTQDGDKPVQMRSALPSRDGA